MESTDGYIETIPRVGYRFVGEVSEILEEPRRPVILAKQQLSRTVIEEEEIPTEPSEVLATQQTAARKPPYPSGFANTRTVLAATAVALIAVVGSRRINLDAATGEDRRGRANLPVKSIAVLPFKTVGYEK